MCMKSLSNVFVTIKLLFILYRFLSILLETNEILGFNIVRYVTNSNNQFIVILDNFYNYCYCFCEFNVTSITKIISDRLWNCGD